MASRVFGWVLGGAMGLGLAQNALACAFHGYTPDPTLVDILLATEQVVIARPDPSNAGRYIPVDVALGPEIGTLPLSVGPATRVQLARTPSATVLLARDGAYGPWLELAVLDDRYRSLIEQVLARQPDWRLGGTADRLALFAGRLNDPNPGIRRLALQEMDRAQYGTLRQARLPAIRNLRQDLEAGDDDLMPIRVLLAGLSRDHSLGPVLSAGLSRAIRNDVAYIGAYATALIELEGAAAVQDLLDRHLRAQSLSVETREKLLEALALQRRTGPAATRRAIVRGVSGLMRDAPELEPAIARQFGLRRHWSLSKPESGTKNRRATPFGGNSADPDR